MRILIAEDDLTSRELLLELLGPYGNCDTAADGREAVKVFRAALKSMPYDLVCMDIMMPHVDGQQALKEIRDIERTEGIAKSREVRVIMTTALCDPKSITEAFHEGGASSYIVKPITRDKLLEKLRKFGMVK
ncbi:MAG: response regulator [Nitrospirota bacterium]|nr:response regulator [Nitrospirota bacterium]